MKLSEEQVKRLKSAIAEYDYPMVAYDFVKGDEKREFDSYYGLENYIRELLLADQTSIVKDGLSNVIYWGYASSRGRQRDRVDIFRKEVTEEQLSRFSMVVTSSDLIRLADIGKCGLPQFSNVSFISKILMFLAPSKYVTLDLQLSKLRGSAIPTSFRHLKVNPTYIPINKQNEAFYCNWCTTCRKMAQEYYHSEELRAVDIERGLFLLVRKGEVDAAAEILQCAET